MGEVAGILERPPLSPGSSFLMPPWQQRRPTMMYPPIEELLDKVDSKFTLVTPGRQAGPADQLLLQPAR